MAGNNIIKNVKNLSDQFQHVILVGPIPPMNIAVHKEALANYGYPGIPSDHFREKAAPILKIFKQVEKLGLPNVTVVFPHLETCDTYRVGRCIGFLNGSHVYADPVHVTKYGQYILYRSLFELISTFENTLVDEQN
ncbi:SGNH hydrolase domain-containing protein [Alphaproteobacteria bacterium]|nr:SGNH hydrolase domain-containing protein [Alphaproteobacteria bacterium]